MQGSVKDIEYIKEKTEQKMCRVDIIASNGNMLRGGIVDTTLIARVTSWDRDITAEIHDNNFIWTRNSGNVDGDENWDLDHAGGMKYITVDADDVGEQATFFCTVNTSDGIQAAAQITVSCNAVQEQLQQSVGEIVADITGLEKIAENINDELGGLQTRADILDGNVSDVRQLYVGLESTIDSIDKNKASLEDLIDFRSLFDSIFEVTPQGLLIKGVDSYGQVSAIATLFGHNRWNILEDGVPVTYVDNKAFNIENGIIRNSLRVGNHDITTDGDSFELTYNGGGE